LSIAEAIESGKPSVIVFATPQFCQSAVCAPMLNAVKTASKGFKDVNFVHVEPYDLDEVPQLVPVESMVEWQLPSEPWVFLLDDKGRMTYKFEGILAPEELQREIKAL
jgi:hypothetical protein